MEASVPGSNPGRIMCLYYLGNEISAAPNEEAETTAHLLILRGRPHVTDQPGRLQISDRLKPGRLPAAGTPRHPGTEIIGPRDERGHRAKTVWEADTVYLTMWDLTMLLCVLWDLSAILCTCPHSWRSCVWEADTVYLTMWDLTMLLCVLWDLSAILCTCITRGSACVSRSEGPVISYETREHRT
ncbi:hypothetical protein Bbelb_068760 [Branchiostoma belcheri]|nr:hypothetical protein Bbelb_068760 [Branchiostoma belcheri]